MEEARKREKKSMGATVWAFFGGLALLVVVGMASFHFLWENRRQPLLTVLRRFSAVLEQAQESDLCEEAERRLRERLEDLGQGGYDLGAQFLP